MSGTYEGLIVGGPWAGKRVSNDKRSMTVHEMTPAPIGSKTPPEPPTHHRYDHVHTGAFGLWIHQSLTLRTALLEMASAYEREHIAIAKAAKGGRPSYPQSGQSPFDGTTSHID